MTKFLRIFSILLILACILNLPLRVFSFRKPWVLVLIDTSKSMSVGNRIEKIKDALPYIKVRKKIYGFDSISYLIKDTVIAGGNETNIANAFNRNPSAYILFSDGVNNSGDDPIDIARNKGIPIYSIKNNDSIQKDIAILDINYNKIAYIRDTVYINPIINNTGFINQEIQVLLKRNGNLVQQKKVLLAIDNKKTELEFYVNEIEAGEYSYEISIPELKDEATYDNNSKEIKVKIINPEIKVGWFSNFPTWNFKFAKQELLADTSIEFDWNIKIGDNKYLSENGIINKPYVNPDYDVVIIENFDYSDIEKFINTKTGVVIIGEGEQDISPIFIENKKIIETQSPIQVKEISIFGEKLLPSLKELYAVKGIKSGARVLCNISDLPGEQGNPVIAAWTYQYRKVVHIAAKDLWRWNLATPRRDVPYSEMKFWDKLVRFAAGRESKVYMDLQPVYEAGKRIVFTAYSYNEDCSTCENNKIIVKIQSQKPGIEFNVPLYSIGDGKYEGYVDFLSSGEYKYRVIQKDTFEIVRDSILGKFSVINNSELQILTPDETFLRTLADVSGGRYIEDIKELENIKLNVINKILFYPAYQWITLLFIVSLLSTEWFIRRKK
ncbi:MAG: hypothetical protein PHX21_03460 [bacterium]|nr:hypothetical protein [bacterium]